MAQRVLPLYEHFGPIVGKIDPDAYSANTYTSGWIDMKDFAGVLAILMVGTMGTNATVDAKFQQATDGSGTGAKDVAGRAITQLTQAGTDDSDKVVTLELVTEDMDRDNSFTHVRFSATNGTAAVDFGALVLGHLPRHGTAVETDLAAVAEVA